MIESSLTRESLVGLTDQGRVDKATREAEQKAEEKRLKRREARARKKRIAENISKTVEQDLPYIDREIERKAKAGEQTYRKTYEVKRANRLGDPMQPGRHLPEDQVAENTAVITGVVDKLIETYTLAGLGAVALNPSERREDVRDPNDGVVGDHHFSTVYGVEISWAE